MASGVDICDFLFKRSVHVHLRGVFLFLRGVWGGFVLFLRVYIRSKRLSGWGWQSVGSKLGLGEAESTRATCCVAGQLWRITAILLDGAHSVPSSC